MTDPLEKKIIRAFNQLAEEAKVKAPAFETMWQEVTEKHNEKNNKYGINSIAAAVTLLLITTATIILYKTCNEGQRTYAMRSLMDWKSPTDVLLSKNASFSIDKIKSFPSDQILEFEIPYSDEIILNDK